MERAYIAIDLKSFYASVECMERGLNPLTTHLVVADPSRTEKTICLAVSPSLKACGIPGRARLFEVLQQVEQVNRQRKQNAPFHTFTGKSVYAAELQADPSLELDFLTAPPRMALYMQYSTRIYGIYLKYIAPEDIHVYSVDEVFIDATNYLQTYHCTARELASRMIGDVLETTGITATAGLGTNLYLCKIAMDILAKHAAPDANGVRIAELDERSYREQLWTHTPLTDFWRIGPGYAQKLAAHGLYTMGDVARCSVGKDDEYYNARLLYKLFGVNAELLIDHAWGWEPCTIADVRQYRPQENSISIGQVLQTPYAFEQAQVIVREMTDALAFDLVKKHLVTDQIMLTIGYDIEGVTAQYKGEVTVDRYGRRIPKHAHGTENLARPTSAGSLLTNAMLSLFSRITDPRLPVRRINVVACRVKNEDTVRQAETYEQLDLFTDTAEKEKQREAENAALDKENRMQKAMLAIRDKYGKNAVLKGTSFKEGATAIDRNRQIGGHKA